MERFKTVPALHRPEPDSRLRPVPGPAMRGGKMFAMQGGGGYPPARTAYVPDGRPSPNPGRREHTPNTRRSEAQRRGGGPGGRFQDTKEPPGYAAELPAAGGQTTTTTSSAGSRAADSVPRRTSCPTLSVSAGIYR